MAATILIILIITVIATTLMDIMAITIHGIILTTVMADTITDITTDITTVTGMVTEMFQFARFASPPYLFRRRYLSVGFPVTITVHYRSITSI